jgi:hypothetical protein
MVLPLLKESQVRGIMMSYDLPFTFPIQIISSEIPPPFIFNLKGRLVLKTRG